MAPTGLTATLMRGADRLAKAPSMPWTLRARAIKTVMRQRSGADLPARVQAIAYVNGIPATLGQGTADGPIWQFWAQGLAEAPPIVKECLASVEANCATRERIMLDMRSLPNYVDIPGSIMDRRSFWDWTKFSNILRLLLLEQRGGTWVDATVFLSRPLTSVVDSPFFMFRRRANPRIIANFLIHARRDHPIVTAMRIAYERYWLSAAVPGNYFMFHYIFEALILSSAPLDVLWASVPKRRVGPVLALRRALHERYEAASVREMLAASSIQKLTYKRPAGDAGTTWEAVCSGQLLRETHSDPSARRNL